MDLFAGRHIPILMHSLYLLSYTAISKSFVGKTILAEQNFEGVVKEMCASPRQFGGSSFSD